MEPASEANGMIQVSTGGGAFASGTAVKDMAMGAISIAEHVHRVAERYPIYVARYGASGPRPRCQPV